MTYCRGQDSVMVEWGSFAKSIGLRWKAFYHAGICSMVQERSIFWDISRTSPEDITSALNCIKIGYKTLQGPSALPKTALTKRSRLVFLSFQGFGRV